MVRRETGGEVNARGGGGIRTVQKMGVADGGVADAGEVLGEWRLADPRRAQEERAKGRSSRVRASVGCEQEAVRTAVSVRIVAFDQFSAVNVQWVSAASDESLLVATSGQASSQRPPCCVIGRFIAISNVSA